MCRDGRDARRTMHVMQPGPQRRRQQWQPRQGQWQEALRQLVHYLHREITHNAPCT